MKNDRFVLAFIRFKNKYKSKPLWKNQAELSLQILM